MKFPQEIVVQTFLPTYRQLLAKALDERGLPQRTIADLVGVTQAQVSKYLAGKVPPEPRIARDHRVQETVDEVAAGLATGYLDTVDALGLSLELIGRLQARGPLAEVHEEEMPKLLGTGFDATLDPDSVAMQEHRVLTEMRLALRRLSDLAGLAPWVPHVGSNLALARPGARDLWDIAALPGRIDAVGDGVRVGSQPTFGASRHVATVVLGVLEVDAGHRAALNLAYREELGVLVEAAGFQAVAFEPGYETRRDRVTDTVRQHVEAHGRLPEVLYHEGDFGIEPVSYVLAPDALDLVARVGELLSPASGRARANKSIT